MRRDLRFIALVESQSFNESLNSGGPVPHVLCQGRADLRGLTMVSVSMAVDRTVEPVIIIQTHPEESN